MLLAALPAIAVFRGATPRPCGCGFCPWFPPSLTRGRGKLTAKIRLNFRGSRRVWWWGRVGEWTATTAEHHRLRQRQKQRKEWGRVGSRQVGPTK